MGKIRCCYKCVEPKRYPGCGDHCADYQAEKAIIAQSHQHPVIAEYICEAGQRYLKRQLRNPHRGTL